MSPLLFFIIVSGQRRKEFLIDTLCMLFKILLEQRGLRFADHIHLNREYILHIQCDDVILIAALFRMCRNLCIPPDLSNHAESRQLCRLTDSIGEAGGKDLRGLKAFLRNREQITGFVRDAVNMTGILQFGKGL